MPRIAGISIPENKQIEISLSYIFGIGGPLAKKILAKAQIEPHKKAKDLSEEEVNKIRKIVEGEYRVEGDLKREIATNIKRLKEIRSWRGMRHAKGLPVRGQKTKKNSRTVRGNIRKTVGSGRKEAPAPK
ncbi:MAG: 30S ribosomal protein S13 [Patescibacteria group bacterium]|nr:30S ribosomal protein S13 [Patescibacteria group bacterium]